MKLGVSFYVTGHTVDAVTVARAVEEAGFESFWVPEHAMMPANHNTAYRLSGGSVPPVYSQMADPFVLLSFVAAVTTTLKVGTGVAIVPEHHPLRLAKVISTLDNFCNGRFLFGLGVGWMREEIELFGTDFDRRWRYTRETVEAMKALWTNGTAEYHGEVVDFPPVICDPMPVQRPHPPVLLGGKPTERLFRRLAAWSDGWVAALLTPDELAAAKKSLVEECERIGRDPAALEVSIMTRDATPEIQHAYEDAGADRLISFIYNHDGVPVSLDQASDVMVAAHQAGPPTPNETLRAIEQIAQQAKL